MQTESQDGLSPEALSVTSALELAKSTLELITLSIVGEVSELSDNSGYSAVYFTLSDQSSALPCVMWRNVYQRQSVQLHRGMLVEVTGRFTLYAAKGRMNFDVRSLRPVGEGDLRLRVAALARRLEAEGLMDPRRRRLVPVMPERIGLVTSPYGKAVHDVLRTLRRRWPQAEVLLAGVTVEGVNAPDQMIAGLAAVSAADADVILLVRGGGSYEDLMPFNDERLARAVAASPIPIVTGIGHEPDTSIVDMVSDFRASTPTAAAEHVSPDSEELHSALLALNERISTSLLGCITRLGERLDRLAGHNLFIDRTQMLRSRWFTLDYFRQRLERVRDGFLEPHRSTVDRLAAQLEAFSPLGILARGYAIATSADGKLIRSVSDMETGAGLNVRLADGLIKTEIREIAFEAADKPGNDADAESPGAKPPDVESPGAKPPDVEPENGVESERKR
jgi:exodeoxyribonuclease VII large subunit